MSSSAVTTTSGTTPALIDDATHAIVQSSAPEICGQAQGAKTFASVSEGRRNNFDAIRFLLATLVIFSHSYPLSYGSNSHDIIARLTYQQADLAWLSVRGFFIISGFLIAMSWERCRGLADFLTKRSLRIFPGLVAALLFCIFVVGPLSGVNLHRYFSNAHTYKFLQTAVLHGYQKPLPGVFVHNPFPDVVDGSMWTIEFEFLCYLLIAVLGIAGLMKKRAVVLGVFAATFILNYQHPSPNITLIWFRESGSLLGFSVYFLAGTVFYLYRDKIPYSSVVFALSITALVAAFFYGQFWIVLPTLGVYALFYVAYLPSRWQHFGRKRDLSYGVYLYAFPVQQLIIQYYGRMLTPITIFLLAWPISCALAYLSWHCVEKPFLKLKTPRKAGPEASSGAQTVPA